MTALTDLSKRLAEASGADRELDAMIAVACDPLWADYHAISSTPMFIATDNMAHVAQPAAYTASLDAATALVERAMPGWSWAAYKDLSPDVDADKRGLAKLQKDEALPCINTQAHTPALAVCSALVAALISQQQEGGGE